MDSETLKPCSRCGEVKPPEEFYRCGKSKNGRAARCKACSSAAARAWNAANPERCAANAASWRRRHPERTKTTLRRAHLKGRYNLTPEGYERMLGAQDHRCAICRRHESEFPRLLAVDHDHETGEVRALLCGRCNPMLGNALDDPEILRAAAKYLEDFAVMEMWTAKH